MSINCLYDSKVAEPTQRSSSWFDASSIWSKNVKTKLNQIDLLQFKNKEFSNLHVGILTSRMTRWNDTDAMRQMLQIFLLLLLLPFKGGNFVFSSLFSAFLSFVFRPSNGEQLWSKSWLQRKITSIWKRICNNWSNWYLEWKRIMLHRWLIMKLNNNYHTLQYTWHVIWFV